MSVRALRVTHATSSVVLTGDERQVIGRAPHATVVFDDPRVSREHLVVYRDGDRWVLEDLGSTGGTWQEGRRVDRLVVTEPVDLHVAAPDGPILSLVPTEQDAPDGAPAHHPAGPTGSFRSDRALPPLLRIGRAEDNEVVVDDLLVSRHHAEIRRRPDGEHEVADLGSRNGTFVNGRRVSRAPVRAGDVLGVGRYQFVLRDDRLDEYADTGSVTFASRGVSVSGDQGPLVDRVSFLLPERSMLGVVGPSGAGKSSLLAALGGLAPVSSGRVLYEGRDLRRDYEELKSRIGFVPQADLLHDGLTVQQALRFAARLRFPPDVTAEERDTRIDEVLTQLGIADRRGSRIDRLSGGERKRVNVATELLTRPSLLLLDEPASGLDAGLERVLMQLLRELADAGHTVIVVTHELDSLHLCDQVLVLAPGGVPAFVGEPGDTRERFGHGDLVEAFRELGTHPEHDWRDRSAQLQAESGQVDLGERGPAPDDRARRPRQGWWSQVRTLTARFVAVLAADRRNVGLLVLQAPVLGVLMLVALPADELAPPAPTQVRFVSTAGLVLFVVLLGATWLGANNAIREIARERAVLRRERTVGVSVSAYVTSKAVVLGALTALQAIVLAAVATARQGGPTDAVVLGWPFGELALVVALAGVASMALALLVSSVVGSPDRATTILPIVLILQFVLSAGGVLPELVDKPVLRELSAASSAQWGFAGAASTADLNELQAFTDQLRDLRTVDAADPQPAIDALEEPASPEGRWSHEPRAWSIAVASLVALTVVPLMAATLVLRRRGGPG